MLTSASVSASETTSLGALGCGPSAARSARHGATWHDGYCCCCGDGCCMGNTWKCRADGGAMGATSARGRCSRRWICQNSRRGCDYAGIALTDPAAPTICSSRAAARACGWRQSTTISGVCNDLAIAADGCDGFIDAAVGDSCGLPEGTEGALTSGQRSAACNLGSAADSSDWLIDGAEGTEGPLGSRQRSATGTSSSRCDSAACTGEVASDGSWLAEATSTAYTPGRIT